jgi:hypothetical protein
MPRDKNKIHRATSDVEDEVISDDESVVKEQQQSEIPSKSEDSSKLEERKKLLKDAILKRTLALKQQRERGRSQKVNSTM